ncbi:MAG TPA: hypothetical protein PKV72_04335 [Candidatus Peribacteria bacterium]|nr:hypothetical protein [Candidatus Peribacteria bacterium]
MQLNTLESGPARIHVVNDIASGSIRTVDELRGVLREVVEPLLADHPAVALPKGVIDRSVFPIGALHPIPNELAQSKMHQHATVHLVPDGTGATGTLITSMTAAVRALNNVFSDPKILDLYRRGTRLPAEDTEQGWTVEKMRLACRVALNPGITLDGPEIPDWMQGYSDRNGILALAYSAYSPVVYGHGQETSDEHALQAAFCEHQLALGADAVTLDWTLYDAGSIARDVIHGRDARTSPRRGNGERLYDALRIPQ